MQTTDLQVDGMTCGSCVASVTKALKRVPGVHDVEVDLRSGVARIRGDNSAEQVPQLVAALRESGYSARVATGAAEARGRSAGGCGAGGATARGGGGCCCG